MAEFPTSHSYLFQRMAPSSFSGVYGAPIHEPSPSWIMTDGQRNQLMSLAQKVSLETDLKLSIHIDGDSMTIGFYKIEDEEEGEE